METTVFRGRDAAMRIQTEEIKPRVDSFRDKTGKSPKLVAFQVGSPGTSMPYIRTQQRSCARVGIEYDFVELPMEVTEAELIAQIEARNADPDTTAIILQLPLPEHLEASRLVDAIADDKDAEGMKPANLGRVVLGDYSVAPCTAKGILAIIRDEARVALRGREVVIVGNSDIVGKPLTMMLTREFATVSLCHIATTEANMLPTHLQRGDVVVVAVGVAHLITGEHLKQGAVLVDVGINPIEGGITGDLDFETCKPKASFITPVPGGVGLMTGTMLLDNIANLFERQHHTQLQ
eukprot:gnl/Trimastix_PCT/1621.p1 GENE.gnl/Trimastix_PCT/1621~~gnl/Trimastix_PCT/1621.p1  ORF type:complete len:306 (+),score=105.38 gnl/Trimastix_PCT/1621:41-919(+)